MRIGEKKSIIRRLCNSKSTINERTFGRRTRRRCIFLSFTIWFASRMTQILSNGIFVMCSNFLVKCVHIKLNTRLPLFLAETKCYIWQQCCNTLTHTHKHAKIPPIASNLLNWLLLRMRSRWSLCVASVAEATATAIRFPIPYIVHHQYKQIML